MNTALYKHIHLSPTSLYQLSVGGMTIT